MAGTVLGHEHHPRSHTHVLPLTPLGWWGFALMLVAVVGCPALWAALTPLIKHSDPDTHIRTAITIAIAVPSLVVGVLALLRREARSVLLIAVSAVVAVEIAWVVVFAVSID
jgi:hypothetical protein